MRTEKKNFDKVKSLNLQFHMLPIIVFNGEVFLNPLLLLLKTM